MFGEPEPEPARLEQFMDAVLSGSWVNVLLHQPALNLGVDLIEKWSRQKTCAEDHLEFDVAFHQDSGSCAKWRFLSPSRTAEAERRYL